MMTAVGDIKVGDKVLNEWGLFIEIVGIGDGYFIGAGGIEWIVNGDGKLTPYHPPSPSENRNGAARPIGSDNGAAQEAPPNPRFNEGDRVHVVIRGTLQNLDPATATAVKSPFLGVSSYHLKMSDGTEGIQVETDLEPAADMPAAVPPMPNPALNGQAGGNGAAKTPNTAASGGSADIIKSDSYIRMLTDMGYTFKLNELDDTVEVNGKPISDVLRAKIFSQMADRGFKGMQRVEYIYTGHAYDNRYHPVKDYLSGLEWDGREHVARFLDHLTFAENKEIARAFMWRWMLGAVGKVFNHEQNFMLVFDGKQDIGKSHLVRWLCPLPGYFIEGAIKPDDKDSYLRLVRHWIWEVSELPATTRKADREALKSFITMKWVTVRKAFGRYDLHKPACASMIGTVNESGSGFLDDRTGSRRFAVVNIKHIDWNYAQTVDVNQLWAEIVASYHRGERGTLSPEEKREQSIINAGYCKLSTVEEYLWEFYVVDADSAVWLPVRDVLKTLEKNGLTGNQQANLMELGQILKSKESEGVKKGRPKIDAVKTTSYKGLRKIG